MPPDYEGHQPDKIPPWCPIPDREWLQSLRDSTNANSLLLARIDARLEKINGTIAAHEKSISTLLLDRTVWTYMVRAFVVLTPFVVLAANYWWHSVMMK